jgi:hypothetical protein
MLDFRIYKFLASIVTPELNISSSLKIANLVADLLGKYVGEAPSILPIPQDAPPEIPRIIFSSPDKKWKLNISLERTNLFYDTPPTSTDEVISIDEFSSIASGFFGNYQKGLDLRVQRIAIVTERLAMRDDALDYVLGRFCNEKQITKGRPFFNTKRFEIHSLKKYNWENFSVNSWVRTKFLPIKIGDGETAPVILVINDLNTLSSDEAREAAFLADDIKAYFEKAPQHLSEILKLYFD